MNYKKIYVEDFNDLDSIYKELLENKWQFVNINDKYILTKEKSLLKINDIEEFLKEFENDIYYKTIFNEKNKVNDDDLMLYKKYINKYRNKMENIYGDKYLFGSVAVKAGNGFITTIRGKENFDDYTMVNSVDHENNVVRVSGRKATLNAPLLDNLFKNEKVKVIVHINHEYDDSLVYYEYAFPGTKKDSFRENNTSFNIKNHGVFYLFDKYGNML